MVSCRGRASDVGEVYSDVPVGTCDTVVYVHGRLLKRNHYCCYNHHDLSTNIERPCPIIVPCRFIVVLFNNTKVTRLDPMHGR